MNPLALWNPLYSVSLNPDAVFGILKLADIPTFNDGFPKLDHNMDRNGEDPKFDEDRKSSQLLIIGLIHLVYFTNLVRVHPFSLLMVQQN